MHLYVEGLGWEHPGWVGSFYPEDLPADWRLSYYANELDAVLIPGRQALAAVLEEFEQWRDDVKEGFPRFLELPPEAFGEQALGALSERVAILGARFGETVARPFTAGEIARAAQRLSARPSCATALTQEGASPLEGPNGGRGDGPRTAARPLPNRWRCGAVSRPSPPMQKRPCCGSKAIRPQLSNTCSASHSTDDGAVSG